MATYIAGVLNVSNIYKAKTGREVLVIGEETNFGELSARAGTVYVGALEEGKAPYRVSKPAGELSDYERLSNSFTAIVSAPRTSTGRRQKGRGVTLVGWRKASVSQVEFERSCVNFQTSNSSCCLLIR